VFYEPAAGFSKDFELLVLQEEVSGDQVIGAT